MWESNWLPSVGNSLLRKFTPILTAFIAVLFGYLLTNSTAHAVDAGWSGDSVIVGSDTYTKSTDTIPGIPPGSQVYVHQDAAGKKASVVYFPSGTDINNATSAQYAEYAYNPPSEYTSESAQQAITVSPKSGAQARSDASTGDELTGDNKTGQKTDCAIQGIGWIVCPATRAAASLMDKIFTLLKSFFEVKTIVNDQDSAIYRAWDTMRGFANLCFIVAFLLIIYSQITSYGINNYEIKKMIPKLIISAILVNVSYYICAAAVDLSNILGNSLQQMFTDMRGGIVGANTAANTDATSWKSITTFILSGGTIAAAGLTSLGLAVASGAGALALVAILVPFLLGVLVSAIVALLILAARQALIVIFVAIAPLAFVAFLLPSTEKWFDRWKDVMTTMLVMFPMFAVVFGGAQLAGGLIIQSADSINMILIGMFAQVAPLIITPLIIKLSGSLLGRVAGMVNNRQKGFIDSTRNRLQEADKRNRTQRMAEGAVNMARGGSRYGSFKNWAASREGRRHEKEGDNHAYEEYLKTAGDAHWKDRLLEGDNDGSQNIFAPGGARRRKLNSVRDAYASTYGAQSRTDVLDAMDKKRKEEAKSGVGNTPGSSFYSQYGAAGHPGHNSTVSAAAQKAALDNVLETQAAQSASRVLNREISGQFEATDANGNMTPEAVSLQLRAAGIDTQFGQGRALANAIKTRANDRSEGLKDIELMIDMKNPSSGHLHELATGNIGHTVPGINVKITDEIKEVAIKKIAGGPNIQAINDLGAVIDLSENSDDYFRTAFVDSLKANSSRPTHYSAGLLDQLGQGIPGGFGAAGVKNAMLAAIRDNKFDANGLVSNDKSTLQILDNFMSHDSDFTTDPVIMENLRIAITELANNPRYKGTMGNRKEAIRHIGRDILQIDFSTLPNNTEF